MKKFTKKSVACRIYERGLVEVKNPTPEQEVMLRAFAAMLREATKPTKKAEKKPKPPLLYTEADVLDSLDIEFHITRYGMLNRVLRTMNLQPDDLDYFTPWFNNSMLPWFKSKEVEVTISMLCRKYPEWLEKARQSGTPKEEQESNWR